MQFAFALEMSIIVNVVATHERKKSGRAAREDEKMNYRQGFEVKFPEKQIVLTKDFARKVSDITSAEHATFMQLRAAYPSFSVMKYTINQKMGREHYSKLSYENMAILIGEWEKGNPAALAELEQKKREAKCLDGSYGIVKKWFLEKYGVLYAAYKRSQNEN